MTTLETSDLPLHDKVAVVTGSSRSIGAAIAIKLAQDGASVVVNYFNSKDAAQNVVDQIVGAHKGSKRAVAIMADAGTIAGGKSLLEDTIKAFGKVDIVVLNAAISVDNTLSEIDEAVFDAHMKTNVKGPLFMAKAAVEFMPSPGGRIIFISSGATSNSNVSPKALCYVASKGAIEQISRVLAKDLGARGITVNTVSPGPVETSMFLDGRSAESLKNISALAPLNRIGKPEEIAPVVAFLASPAAGWVNGQNIRANGGYVV